MYVNSANHTNRELELMLAGQKPFAFFCEEKSFLPNEEIIPEEKFGPYVQSGRFVKAEDVVNVGFNSQLGRDAMLKYVFYALPSESWRIPAFKLVLQVTRRTGRYPEEMQRLESLLLGYSEAEIDIYCQHLYAIGAT